MCSTFTRYNRLCVAVLLLLCLSLTASFQHNKSKWMQGITRLFAITTINNQDDFEKNCKSDSESKTVVVNFHKSNCRPCLRISPLFDALSTKYEPNAIFFQIDADSSKEALAVLKNNMIRSVPSFQIWKAGKLLDTVHGAHIDMVEESLLESLK